jgi:hypothetical protein
MFFPVDQHGARLRLDSFPSAFGPGLGELRTEQQNQRRVIDPE